MDSLVGRDDLPDVPISRLSDTGMVSLMTSYVLFSVIRYARDIHIFERAQRARRMALRASARAVGHPRRRARARRTRRAGGAGAWPASGFDVRGWSRSREVDRRRGVQRRPRDARRVSWRDTEILVVMLPLTPDTRGLLDARRLSLLPRGAKLDQCLARRRGRRAGADRGAARRARIAEATLDVFTVEPLPADHAFWRMENVLITPHLASITVPEAAAREVAESIRRVRARPTEPLHRIDPRRGY